MDAMRNKARAMIEPGVLEMNKPAPPPNKMSANAKRAQMDNARPIGFAKGGQVKKNWIQGAIKKPGALRRELGVAKGKKIPAAKLDKAAKAGGKLGRRARLAKTLKGMKKADGGSVKSDKTQDRALMKRHNRLMHPGQKSKLRKGGVAKMAAGGVAKIRHGVANADGSPKQQPRRRM